MKKKLLYILFIGILLIGMTGCGSKEEKEESDNQTTNNSAKGDNSSVLNVGDLILYTADNVKTYTSPKSKNGVSDQSFDNSRDVNNWIVLYVNEDGSAVLGATQPVNRNLLIESGNGWLNYEEELNNIGGIYKDSKYVIEARCLSYEDVIKSIGIDKIAEKDNIDISSYHTDEEKIKAILESDEEYGQTINIVEENSKYVASNNEIGYEISPETTFTSTKLHLIDILSSYGSKDAFSLNTKYLSMLSEGFLLTNKHIRNYENRRYYEVYKISNDDRIADGEIVISTERIFTGAEYGDDTVSGHIMPVIVLDKNVTYNKLKDNVYEVE